MTGLMALAEAIVGQGYAAAQHIDRQSLAMVEHGELPLPADIIRADGSFDLYADVQNKFEIQYKNKLKRLVIRSGGWVGHVPLNDRYALDIDTRVPVANIERLLARTPDARAERIGNYTHAYRQASDRPQSLFDVLTDHFLLALDQIWREGLHKQYLEHEAASAMPFGRISPFKTALFTKRSGTPVASYSAFIRTENCAPNRILRYAIERLILRYSSLDHLDGQRVRSERLKNGLAHLSAVSRAIHSELSPDASARYISQIPAHRGAYIDALRLAQYVVADLGLAIRGTGGLAILPAMIIDMEVIFENYARAVLKRDLEGGSNIKILDGNIAGPGGAKDTLFTRMDINAANPDVKPDIVVEKDGIAELIIDAKYKPAKALPDRSETNQLMCYAARYNCKKVMVLYPDIPKDGASLISLGMVGETQVFRVSIDLGSADLDQQEAEFSRSIADVVA